jgi:hypothetical protein
VNPAIVANAPELALEAVASVLPPALRSET